VSARPRAAASTSAGRGSLAAPSIALPTFASRVEVVASRVAVVCRAGRGGLPRGKARPTTQSATTCAWQVCPRRVSRHRGAAPASCSAGCRVRASARAWPGRQVGARPRRFTTNSPRNWGNRRLEQPSTNGRYKDCVELILAHLPGVIPRLCCRYARVFPSTHASARLMPVPYSPAGQRVFRFRRCP
jgi:hypothetical protein